MPGAIAHAALAREAKDISLTHRSLAATLLGTLLCIASPALANTITISTGAPPAFGINPSSDSISLNVGSATLSTPGNVIFQTGNISVGDSQIPDQVIPFSFTDIVTINGISRSLTIFGQDNVTSTADLITFSAGTPVNFGSYVFTLNSSTYSATSVGQNIPVNLSANVSAAPVPEPATLPLLATGVMGAAVITSRRRHRSPFSL